MIRKILVPLILTTIALADERKFAIVIDRTVVKNYVPELIKSYGAWVIQRNNRSYINGFLVLKQKVHQLDLRSELHFYRSNSQRVTVYDLRYDGCQFLNFVGVNKLLARFFQIFISSVNEVPSCPLKANFNYTMTNYMVKEDLFPAFMPEGKVRAINRYIHNKTVAFYIIIEARIINKKSKS